MTTWKHHVTRAAATSGLVIALMAAPAGAQEQSSTQSPTVPVAAAAARPASDTIQAPERQALPEGAEGTYPKVTVTAGRSTVLTTDYDVTRIAVTNPAIADATVVQPREILIDAKTSGTISLIVWGTGKHVQYDLVVQPAITTLQTQLQALFPGEDIHVNATDDALVLAGHVSSNTVMLRAAEIAQASASKAKVINMLQVPGGNGSQQVMLQVRFAEVNRQALMQLGVNLFTGPTGYKNTLMSGSTGQFPGVNYSNLSRSVDAAGNLSTSGQMTFSDFLNLFVFSYKYNVGALITALQSTGNLQSLAEPNLLAYNGQEASFLAGGEIPVPIVQGVTNAVTIVYKEFGIRLTFKPTIAGDVIRLHLRPEVSSLDFANGISLSGFRIPALTTRYAETEVELRDGQSFAIAGLMDNVSQVDRSMIPVLGNIPIIGYLFKSKAERKTQTELMVLITPRLVRPLNPDEVPTLPTSPKGFLPVPGIGGKGNGGPVDAPIAPPKKKDPGQK